jgi:hypothetical protein
MNAQNEEIVRENTILKDVIRSQVEHRKKMIREYEEQYEKALNRINIPLKRIDIAETPLVDLKIRKTVQNLRKPVAHPQEEFVLQRDYVLDILEILDRSGREFELNPEVFGVKLEEEDLRSIILAHLNTIFEGSATGETFSKFGKTDIHLNIARGQIFIAECKFWQGPKYYREDAINQLFRYLTWRQNYAAIINQWC